MKTNTLLLSLIILATIVLSGCKVGYSRLLFATKSNVGLDIDTTPPTLEVSIARREGVIAPSFEDGKTPPVMASFGVKTRGLSLLLGASSTMAGGDAATTMAHLFVQDTPDNKLMKYPSELCLSRKPEAKRFKSMRKIPTISKDTTTSPVNPFFFGTDTSLGVKLAWSGMTSAIPDTVRIGFSRKELAYAPITGRATNKGDDCTDNNNRTGKYIVSVPSFLASTNNSVGGGTMGTTKITYIQYFATGTAATQLALEKDIRSVLLERLMPDVVKASKYMPDDNTKKIKTWLYATNMPENTKTKKDAKKAKQTERRNKLQSWMTKEDIPGSPTDLLYRSDYQKKRSKAIKAIEKGFK
jgi:hypothetical protein